MSERPIAVVVAMKREVAPLLQGRRGVRKSGLQVFEMGAAAIAIGGIGRNAASHTAEFLAREYSPALLVSAGIAGAVTDTGKVGDIFFAQQVVDADTGERFASWGERGTVVTVSSVSGPDDKCKLAEHWQADVADMEASAVADVAKTRGIDFLAIKSISDELGFVMPPLGRFVSRDGKFQMVRFSAFLAVHPEWWKCVGQLNSNSRIASVKLSEALRHLIDRWSRNQSAGPPIAAKAEHA